MHNLKTFETPNKPKKCLSVRTKLSVEARILKTCLEKLHDLCYLMIAHTWPFFMYQPSYHQYELKLQYVKLTQL